MALEEQLKIEQTQQAQSTASTDDLSPAHGPFSKQIERAEESEIDMNFENLVLSSPIPVLERNSRQIFQRSSTQPLLTVHTARTGVNSADEPLEAEEETDSSNSLSDDDSESYMQESMANIPIALNST